MVYHIINQAELQKAIRDEVEECLSSGKLEGIATYNHRRHSWEPDQEAIDSLRKQVRDYLLDYLTELLNEALDYTMDPSELIGEFYDWEPEGIQAGHLITPDGMDDSIYADMEHDRRRDDRLLLASPDRQCLTPQISE